MKEIAKAFIAAQKEMENPLKEASNPYFKSKYADLNSVRAAVIPPLNEQNICVLQPIVNIDGKSFVKTIFLHESGEEISGLTEIIYSKQNDAQSQGSGITYARRYGLQSLACIGAEDDDGNKASLNDSIKENTTKNETLPLPKSEPAQLPELTKEHKKFENVKNALIDKRTTIDVVKDRFSISPELEEELKSL